MSIVKILTGILSLIAIGFAIFMYLNKNRHKKDIPKFEIDRLILEDVITWFKSNKIEHKNYIYMLLKPENELFSRHKIDIRTLHKSSYKDIYVQLLFDEQKKIIINMRVIYCSEIDNTIKEQFSNKDIIIYS